MNYSSGTPERKQEMTDHQKVKADYVLICIPSERKKTNYLPIEVGWKQLALRINYKKSKNHYRYLKLKILDRHKTPNMTASKGKKKWGDSEVTYDNPLVIVLLKKKSLNTMKMCTIQTWKVFWKKEKDNYFSSYNKSIFLSFLVFRGFSLEET